MSDLSVIIPVYNGARFISQAIDSVLAQNGIRAEIIVVNDGSTDDTLRVLEHYACNVDIHTIKHVGASAARNYGLSLAHGEYIMFLDADDFISDNEICLKCLELAREKSLEMVMFSFRYLNNKTNKYVDVFSYGKELEGLCGSAYLFPKMIKSGVFPASPCFKIIRRDFLTAHDLFFKGQMIAEDIEWYVRLMIAINRFGLIDEPAYVYRKNVPGSLTFTMDSEKCTHFLLMIQEALRSIEKVNIRDKQLALYSGMAYEYCILIGNADNVNGNRWLESELKRLSWLLEYDLFPRIKWAKRLYHALGYRITAYLFGSYIRYFSKSKR